MPKLAELLTGTQIKRTKPGAKPVKYYRCDKYQSGCGSLLRRAVRVMPSNISYARILSVKALLKSLIVWLLLLAIPFQGFASATMLVCAPIESAPQILVVSYAATIQHHHHAMANGSGTEEQQHHAASASAKADEAGAGNQSFAHHHAGGKCNSCAICCFGASIAPSYASRVPAEVQHFSIISFEVDRIASVDLALPERPPQTSLT